ncbi:MAG: DNA-directed RNA polymerase subunit A'' [Halobacteria archaeon]
MATPKTPPAKTKPRKDIRVVKEAKQELENRGVDTSTASLLLRAEWDYAAVRSRARVEDLIGLVSPFWRAIAEKTRALPLPAGVIRELQYYLLKHEKEIDPEDLDRVFRLVVQKYREARVEPCEPVGIVAAQSIGEPGTQMTMRTFHYAGVAELNVTLGLPRLIEIVDARRIPSTPIMTIYLDRDCRYDREKAHTLAREIEATYMDHVGELATDSEDNSLEVRLDPALLEKRKLTFETVDRRLAFTEVKKDVRGNRIRLTPKSGTYKDLLKLRDRVRRLTLRGISSIERVVIRKVEDEFVLYTEGSDLERVLKVKGIDAIRTRTNNIYEVAETLGIEAARNLIIHEATETLGEQGLDVDVRHIMLVADIMTADGEVKQIGRHGIAGEKASVLSRAAFEVTTNQLLDAAVRGDVDALRGVTENVIVGQPIRLGTGDVELVAKRYDRPEAPKAEDSA